MYPLGKQFEVDYTKAKSDKKTVVQGNNYRISVITERVVRLEFSPAGQFNDRPTQLIKKRNVGIPDFSVRQDANIVEVTTKYFSLSYIKGQPFTGTKVDPMKNLKITLLSRERDRNKDWFVGHPEARNMLGNMVGVDVDIPVNLQKGLYSLDGFTSIDDSFGKVIMEDGTLGNPIPNHLDIYVFMYDRDFKQVLFDYFKMTGAPALIPRYALGNWWSRNIVYDDKEINNLVRKFEKKKIPISVMLFDHDWHIRDIGENKNLRTGFTFNQQVISNPQGMISDFHRRGIRVGLCVDPMNGIYPHEQYYKQASEYLGIKNNTVIQFDPLNPKLLDVLFKMFLHPLEALGVDFFWNDSTCPDDVNKLWALNHYMYLDSGRNSNKRALLLGRGGIYAPHRYPVLYVGSS